MTVCVIFPAACLKVADKTLEKWHALGYQSAVLQTSKYPGFPRCMNLLCKSEADIFVGAGDDLDPDPKYLARELGEMFCDYFHGTFGLMQPSGDKFGALAEDATIPAAVSPWIGKEFIRLAYDGAGPYFPGYYHLWADAEIWHVAEQAERLWINPNVTQYHHHFTRGHTDSLAPELRRGIAEHGKADQKLFEQRRADGFPGAW